MASHQSEAVLRKAISRLTQAEVAKRLNCDPSIVSRFLGGEKQKLGIEEIGDLLDACEVDIFDRETGSVRMCQREHDALRFYAEKGFNGK